MLRNKRILLISSESWGSIYLSKHNYAIALAKLDNTVFFLNPVSFEMKHGQVKCERSDVHPNLYIISYTPFFPWIIKFHARWLFRILLDYQIKKLLKVISEPLDIVWDFNCSYLYDDLRAFGAKISIFQPVDHLTADTVNKKADLFVTISQSISSAYQNNKTPRLLINHGLADTYEEIACLPPSIQDEKKSYNACYIGNLTIPSLDRHTFMRIIQKNNNVVFHLIGPYEGKSSNIGAGVFDKETEVFICELKKLKNVVLYGALTQKQIAEKIKMFDLFFLCYRSTQFYKSDNSHKVLEYFSSGKVTVTNFLSAYENSPLLLMAAAEKNDMLPEMVANAIRKIHIYNSIEMQWKRKEYALNNTYRAHVERIGKVVDNIQ